MKDLGLLLVLSLFSISCAAETLEKTPFEKKLLDHWQAGQLIPHLSQHPGQTSVNPYTIQKRYVDLRLQSDQILGFKAGLTSKAGQNKFGVQSALSGVLFQSGLKPESAHIQRANFGKLMIETELGFRLNRTITRPIKDIETLKSYVFFVAPVIELPDLGFAQPDSLKGNDIIAANVASNWVIEGKPMPVDAINDLNNFPVRLLRNGQEISLGKGSDALGDQWQALLWLVNHTVEQGYAITDKHLLITGALGNMLPAEPGQYTAHFDALGSIKFEIQ